MTIGQWVTVILGVPAAAVAVWYLAAVGPAWIRARRAGLQVELMEAIGMRMRSHHAASILRAAVEAKRGGVGVTVQEVEILALAGGDYEAAVCAMVLARELRVPCEWSDIQTCALAGLDVQAIVRERVAPGTVVGSAKFVGRFRKQTVPR
jgi:uncharacterized protein YqfA (UPF0365 family)